jgi:malonate-semialdehyde dehydrogenase (acetylating)/methylmalonate-semialdehyde dehydrogenase
MMSGLAIGSLLSAIVYNVVGGFGWRVTIIGYVTSTEGQGATLVADGRTIQGDALQDGYFVGPTVIDHVTQEMDVYRNEVFGPVLVVLRAETLDDAIALINANPYGNGTSVFTGSGHAARRFQREVHVGMIGINVPIPVPMAYYSFGGWKDSLFGDTHVHGPEGVRFYTRAKVVTSRWPQSETGGGASYSFPHLELSRAALVTTSASPSCRARTVDR